MIYYTSNVIDEYFLHDKDFISYKAILFSRSFYTARGWKLKAQTNPYYSYEVFTRLCVQSWKDNHSNTSFIKFTHVSVLKDESTTEQLIPYQVFTRIGVESWKEINS